MFQAFALALRSQAGEWGLSSIRTMVGDPQFAEALRVTLLLLVIILPVQFALAMAMALIVNARLRGSTTWLYIYALPLGVSELTAGIIWFSILTEQGWLNSILQSVGAIESPVIWLDYRNPLALVIMIVIAETWRATSIIMIILVAGLQSIPREYAEAADVLGATPWARVRRVILPLLKPTIRVALILRAILAFQAFAVVIAIAGRGTTVLAREAFRQYAQLQDPNVAAAYAALILLLSMVATIGFLWLIPAEEGVE